MAMRHMSRAAVLRKHGALQKFCAPLLRMLLGHGAGVSAVDRRGRTALHVAIENQSQEAVRLLVEAGAPLDLFAAAGMGDAERVATLLREQPSLAQAEQTT